MQTGSTFLKHHQANCLFVLGGIFLGIGFVFSWLWPLGLFGIALTLEGVRQAKTLTQAALGVWITWTLKALFAIGWFWTTYPLDVFSVSLGSAEVAVVGFYWLTTGLALGAMGLVLGGALWPVVARLRLRWLLLAIPLLWLAAEIASSLVFSLFTLGAGSSANFVFSVGYVGYLFAQHTLLVLLAALGGAYGLTLIVVGAGVGIWLLGRQWRQRLTLCTLLSFGLVAGLIFTSDWSKGPVALLESNTATATTVAIIDTTFGRQSYQARSDKENYRQSQLAEAVLAALATGANYIVMPEDSRLGGLTASPEDAYRRFRFMYQDPSAIVIEAGRYGQTATSSYLRATIYDGKEQASYFFDKTYLVPQGEYVPYFYSSVLSFLGYEETVSDLKSSLNYLPGESNDQSTVPRHLPGILFCYEQKNPLAVRRLVHERDMPFVAHPISHAWFHTPEAMWDQYDAMLTIHAVWNQVPIVSAGNMASGYLYLPSGHKVTPVAVAAGERWVVSVVSW